MRKAIHKTLVIAFAAALIVGCTAKGEDPGVEYSPQMYHSTAYEPLTQITDKSMGDWLDSNPVDGHGEFYNSNPYNEFGMTMREPVAGTVPRGQYLPYRIEKDSVAMAANLVNPYEGRVRASSVSPLSSNAWARRIRPLTVSGRRRENQSMTVAAGRESANASSALRCRMCWSGQWGFCSMKAAMSAKRALEPSWV